MKNDKLILADSNKLPQKMSFRMKDTLRWGITNYLFLTKMTCKTYNVDVMKEIVLKLFL